jgi:AAA family ATP:ADP antiporter
MLIAAGLLAISIILAKIVNAREKRLLHGAVRTADTEKPVGQADGFGLVMRQRYLLLIALLMVVANLVNTTGEYILGKKVTDEAQLVIANEERRTITETLGSPLTSAQREKVAQVFVGEFYGNFFFWLSLCQALIQLFLVSRIFKYFGLAGALYFLPVVALGSYSLIAVIPVLSYIRIAKITEKSVDYSVQNTARQTLFLPTSREVKYKAKAAIDTFFVRFGDVLAAVLVFGGVTFAFSISAFALVNIFITGLWLLLAMGIVREHRKLLGAATRAGGIESRQDSRTMMKEDIRLLP